MCHVLCVCQIVTLNSVHAFTNYRRRKIRTMIDNKVSPSNQCSSVVIISIF